MNFNALKSSNFRLYLAGNVSAVNGLWMMRVTIGWLAWELSGSASFVGLIAFLQFAPTMIASPLFGVLADRVDVRRGALATQSVMMTLVLVLLALRLTGFLDQVTLAVFAAAIGLSLSANGPFRMSLAPRLVQRGEEASVVNLTAINFNLARMTGPAIGGWMIGLYGVDVTLILVVLCYIPFLASLCIVQARPRANTGMQNPPFIQALTEGARHVFGARLIREALLLTAAGSFFVRGTLEILPVLADGVFERGAGGLGILTSAAGLGALLGGISLAVSARIGDGLPPRVYVLCLFGFLSMAALGSTSTWEIALLMVAAMSFCVTAVGIICQSAIQVGIDDTIRGRVMSFWSLVAIGAAATGAAVLGAIADVLSFGGVASIGAALAVTLFAIGFVIRNVRNMSNPRDARARD